MFITLYQEYENQNHYTSELLLIFRRCSYFHPQCAIHSGNTLEKALNKIGREDIVNKCIFNVELVTDDVEKAVARVRLDQPGFDSLKEELGPSRNTSLRRDATMDPKMDPDYEEPDRMKDSESVEDLSVTGSMHDKSKEHITITNGTVFNGTSTPIKDKYASDEKELGDMMADYLEQKCHVTDTMSKKSRDELDDMDKKRQKVIADANKIVSDVTEEAARQAQHMAEQASSISTKTGHDSAEIDGTVERHATSAPSKQPVPAPRHSTTKPSTKPEFHLELSDASRIRKTVEQPLKSQEAQSPSKNSNLKSKIPLKIDRTPQTSDNLESVPFETSKDRIIGPQAISRTVKYITREYTDGELIKETSKENIVSLKDAIPTIKPNDMIETMINSKVEMTLPVEEIRQTTTTIVTSDPSVDPEKLEELLKTGGIVETVRTVTLTSEDDALQPVTREEVVKRINQVASTLPSEIFDFGENFPDSSTTTIKTDKSESDGVIQTVTTVQRVTVEETMPETERIEKVVRTVISSSNDGDLGDEQAYALKNLQERLMKSEIGETTSWVSMTGEQWETMAQYSQDTSPGSGNGGAVDGFAAGNNKNGSSRHDMHSDTDSDGSPQRRRRSPSKRRTLGSSSGSDVALHEGAELSPLEDDQESDFLQHSEPSFMETTTIEVDPVTQESITTTTRVESRTVLSTGTDGTDDLRESMQKIMDTFMTEERKDH